MQLYTKHRTSIGFLPDGGDTLWDPGKPDDGITQLGSTCSVRMD